MTLWPFEQSIVNKGRSLGWQEWKSLKESLENTDKESHQREQGEEEDRGQRRRGTRQKLHARTDGIPGRWNRENGKKSLEWKCGDPRWRGRVNLPCPGGDRTSQETGGG